ncbi:L,D-transpeptidase [Tessaracoccus sp.]|uniref:L,D-transpeptidase n=1 Tax=Tessaracoccus sp. TaxID=1971211 RepID=UPI002621FFB3|nr:L,D-transpeptidase [Tessaracoccus sp.]
MKLLRQIVIAAVSGALLASGSVGKAVADEGEPPVETAPVIEIAVSATAPSSAYLHSAVAAKGKVTVTNATGDVTVQAQAKVDGAWKDQGAATTVAAAEAGSAFVLPLTYKTGTLGTSEWQVVAAVPASGETAAVSATSTSFKIKRLAQKVSITAATPKRVGSTVTASGKLTGFDDAVTVKAQVYVDGKWSTKKTVTVRRGADAYKVELPYAKNKVGTRTWRVTATSGSQKATSSKVKLQRIPLRAITAKADRTKQIGSKVYAKGKITGYEGKVKVRAQVNLNGNWTTKKTVKVKVKYTGTSYKIELPYGVNAIGTTTWRVLVDDGTAARKSSKFKVSRVAGTIDSRCLTGRTLCISKKDRKMRWMVDGVIKKTFDARFGHVTKYPTRNGSFKVYWKSRDHVSSIYHTPMPFAMFFSGGQAVHYSADFAARGYNGSSHGCVNIRDRSGIRKLFDQVRVGDKVIVYG